MQIDIKFEKKKKTLAVFLLIYYDFETYLTLSGNISYISIMYHILYSENYIGNIKEISPLNNFIKLIIV